MKKNAIVLMGLFLFLTGGFLGCSRDRDRDTFQEPSLTIYHTPDLSELTSDWVSVYAKMNPEINIEVNEVEGSSAVDGHAQDGELLFISDAYDASATGTSRWKEVMGRDVIVAVANARNPFMKEISGNGISPDKLARVFGDAGQANWGMLLENGQDVPVHLYVINDPSVRSGLAGFLDADPEGLIELRATDGNQLISAVGDDLYSVGICKLTDVVDEGGQEISGDIALIPIDGNGNGTIDFKEDIYSDLRAFSRGVWIGKYPRALINNLYSVSSTPPEDPSEAAFLKWVLTDGQALLDNHGFRILEHNERVAKVKLIDNLDFAATTNAGYPVPKEPLFTRMYFLTILTLLAIVLFMTISGIIVRDKEDALVMEGVSTPKPALNVDFVESPQGLYYDRTHTWAFMDKNGLVRIGIDDFLQHVTGPLTNIKMKNPGERIRKGKHVLSIVQDGKQLDICSPVTGTIKEHNRLLSVDTSIINASPYSDGWVYKIEPTNWLKEIQYLFMAGKYKEWLRTEFSRLKDFITDSLRPETVQYAHVLQDGGELQDRILEDLGPEVWEDFQTNFMDVPA